MSHLFCFIYFSLNHKWLIYFCYQLYLLMSIGLSLFSKDFELKNVVYVIVLHYLLMTERSVLLCSIHRLHRPIPRSAIAPHLQPWLYKKTNIKTESWEAGTSVSVCVLAHKEPTKKMFGRINIEHKMRCVSCFCDCNSFFFNYFLNPLSDKHLSNIVLYCCISP